MDFYNIRHPVDNDVIPRYNRWCKILFLLEGRKGSDKAQLSKREVPSRKFAPGILPSVGRSLAATDKYAELVNG